MTHLRRHLLSVSALLLLVACNGTAVSAEDAAWLSGIEGGSLGGKADTVGPMTISSTWAPSRGFVRVVLPERYELSVSPAEGVRIDDRLGSRRIVDFEGDDGIYELQVRDGGSEVASVSVRVSDDAPTVELTSVGGDSTGAGASIEAAPGTLIEVRGVVRDPLGTRARVTLRGRDLDVGADGSFVTQVESVHGLNVLELGTLDAADNFFGSARSFVAAARLGSEASLVHMRLGDAGLGSMLSAISERLPETLHVPSFGEVGSRFGTEVYFDGADLPGQNDNPGSMEVTLDTVRDGQVQVTFIAHGDLIGHMRVDAPLSAERRTTVTVTNLRLVMGLAFEGEGDSLRARTTDVELTDEGLDFDVERFPDWVANLARDTVRTRVKEALEARTGELLTDALRGVAGDYDVPGNELIEGHRLSYRLERILPQADGLGLALEARLASLSGPDAVYGAPLSGRRLEGAPSTDSLSFGLPHDLLNQWIFLQWSAGRLSYSMTECDVQSAIDAVPALAAVQPVIDVHVDTHLAPVVGAGREGALQISAGEVEVSLFLTSAYFHAEIVARVAVEAELNASIEGGVTHFAPSLRSVHVDVREAGLDGLDTEVVERLLEELAPEIANRQASAIRDMPMPSISLDGVGMSDTELRLVSGTASADEAGLSLTGELVLGAASTWQPAPRPEGTPRERCF